MLYTFFLVDGSYGITSSHLKKITTGEEFIQILEDCGLLGPYNVLYLQFLLKTADNEGSQCESSVKDFERYAEKYKDNEILYFEHQPTTDHQGTFSCQVLSYLPAT